MATGRVPTTANSPLTAKGDLFGYSTTQARVAVGNDGETLVADSSTSTGLRWQGDYAAGKNKFINGDFGIWQRGTSSTTNGVFLADRWYFAADGSGSTNTVSQQTFTPGTAPVAGYEGTYFWRLARSSAGSGNTYNILEQKIEDVRTFAGQTVTLSYWAKADSARTSGATTLYQNFGSGGSSQVATTISASQSLTTSWTRFTTTFTVPSVSGKTIGTSSYLAIDIGLCFNSASTTDIWGVQIEAGSVATAFQTATGTLQGELAACQRYYWRTTSGTAYAALSPFGNGRTTTAAAISTKNAVTMRVAPTSVEFNSLALYDGSTLTAVTAVTLIYSTPDHSYTEPSVASGLTANRPYCYFSNNSATGYIAYNAEL